jgi:hypothetical protein
MAYQQAQGQTSRKDAKWNKGMEWGAACPQPPDPLRFAASLRPLREKFLFLSLTLIVVIDVVTLPGTRTSRKDATGDGGFIEYWGRGFLSLTAPGKRACRSSPAFTPVSGGIKVCQNMA